MRSGKLVIINSHPIQYFAPLYREWVGCAPDLIRDGVNGCVLPRGDWKAWSDFIDRWASGQLELQSEGVLGCPVPGFEDSAQAMIKAIENLA